MAWNEGYHCLTEKYLPDTNAKLAAIEGDLSAADAQICFAKFCAANPSFTANLLMGVDIYPFQDIMLRAMMQKDYFLGICGRGLGKSTIASVFIPLYAIFNPGVTIGVTSATFRQSRAIFEKIEALSFGPKGKYLRQCLQGDPKHKSDAWEMTIGTSKIVAIPLGCFASGQRIRTNLGLTDFSLEAGSSREWKNSKHFVDTLNGTKRCSHSINSGLKRCVTIETRLGYEITVSLEHELFASHLGKGFWKLAKDFKSGELIALDKSHYYCDQPEHNLSFEKGYESGRMQFFSNAINERMRSCSREFGKGFLCGLFETGAKFFKLKNNGYGLTIKFANKSVAKEIQQFLLCYGVSCRRILHCLSIRNNELRHFVEFIGEKETPRFQEARSYFNCGYKPEENKSKNIFFDAVKSVKKLGEIPTYEIRVPAENNYVLNGFVSHNSGDKIRGYRFNLLVIDELLLLSEKVINEVLLPFMAIQINPRERQKVREAEGELIRLGLMQPEDATVFPNNKLIGLTSASYEFEYLYEMFKDYKNLIYDQEAENVSHAIMQLSCEMAPPGLYDESNVENARKTYSRAQFDREYMARFTGDSSGFYSAKKLYEITLAKGQSPTVKIKGDPAKNYILAIDPNYDSSEGSDHFAMAVFETDETSQEAYMVHGYAVAACSLSERMNYIKYLFDNFNIVYVIVDRAGGEKFIKDINDLSVLPFTLAFFEAEFETFSSEELFEIRKQYNNGSKIKTIVHSQYFAPQWIRLANETLSGAIDGKRIWFAAPVEAEVVNFDGIDIKNLKFTELESYGNKKEDIEKKKIDFVDNQSLVIDLTKNQCATIEVSTTATGMQRFDLPSSLQKQTGPTKMRKDSYSVLVLGNWGVQCYFALLKTPEKKKSNFKARFVA